MLDSVIEIGFSLETFDSSSVTQQPPEKGILSQQLSQQMSQQLSLNIAPLFIFSDKRKWCVELLDTIVSYF